ncbi:MAG: CatA-like O-acetyltransferase [Pyrinomonadaceae bacterium]
MYKPVDLDNWARRSTYDFFRDFEDPFFNFTANIDVTGILAFSDHHRLGTALSLLHCSLVAANEIREFRIRLLDGELVEFDRVHATQTILNDDETFSFAYFEMHDDIFDFARSGEVASRKYKTLKTFDVETGRVDLVYFSSLPWVSFTSVKHATRLDKRQTIPRIVFGKIFDSDGRKLMPLSVEANHAIMDGLHAARFLNRFQEISNNASV